MSKSGFSSKIFSGRIYDKPIEHLQAIIPLIYCNNQYFRLQDTVLLRIDILTQTYLYYEILLDSAKFLSISLSLDSSLEGELVNGSTSSFEPTESKQK